MIDRLLAFGIDRVNMKVGSTGVPAGGCGSSEKLGVISVGNESIPNFHISDVYTNGLIVHRALLE